MAAVSARASRADCLLVPFAAVTPLAGARKTEAVSATPSAFGALQGREILRSCAACALISPTACAAPNAETSSDAIHRGEGNSAAATPTLSNKEVFLVIDVFIHDRVVCGVDDVKQIKINKGHCV
eukprot:CAMPEP_0180006732 /NCGR_PEP_ID=MMETSP0984-20121128/13472_1 /TAXON_ID=483367 /ORGANISM="non described non described, Strain CCMP 2436" /LENGTH=124 /DNA_ID=CAMNT_0021927703 /DNA_START=106 /DNA_END=477 /DNA_ORIENTATION=+